MAVRQPTKTNILIIGYNNHLRRFYNNFKKNVMLRIKDKYSQEKKVFDNLHNAGTRKRIHNSAISEIGMILDEVEYEQIGRYLRPVVRRYARITYERGASKGVMDVNRIPGFEIHFGLMPVDFEAIEVMIDHNFAEFRNATSFMKKEMIRVLSTGMLEGQSMAKMSRELVKRIDISRKRSNMIVRTETIRNYNQAALNKYKEAGIRKWRWVTAIGDRTCEICLSLDGQVFNMGDPQPPFPHPNCRCSIAPFIDEDSTPGRRF